MMEVVGRRLVVVVNGKGERAWLVVQWCGDFYKGVVVVYEMLQCYDSSLVKSAVQRLLDNGAQFECEMARACK